MKHIISKDQLNNSANQLDIDTDLNNFVNLLIKGGIVDSQSVNINEDSIEVYNLKKKKLPYFSENFIIINVISVVGQSLYEISIFGEDYDEDVDIKQRNQVFRYISNTWLKELCCDITFEN